jgi:hypothetical protein
MECKWFHRRRHFQVQATVLEAGAWVRWLVVVRKSCLRLRLFQVRATVSEEAYVAVRCRVSVHKVSRLLNQVKAEATAVDTRTLRVAVHKGGRLRG